MRRKSIKLQPHEDHQLRQDYITDRFPSDQWAQRPVAFAWFVERWNQRMGRSDAPDDIKHYVINKRKCGKWVRLGKNYEPLRCPEEHDLAPVEWDALRDIVTEINLGREQFATNATLRDLLSQKFFERIGRYVSGDLLYAAIMAAQKHSTETNWPKITPPSEDQDKGFRDIDEVV